MKISLFVLLSSILVISLCGFQAGTRDAQTKGVEREGVAWRFKARIIDIEKMPDKTALVVNKMPVTEGRRGKKIYVLVTADTIIGSQVSARGLDDLAIGEGIFVEGTKIVEKEGDEEFIVVIAERIRPIME